MFLKLIFILITVYLLLLTISCGFQRKLVFFPGKLEKDFAFDTIDNAKEITIATEDSIKISALYYKTGGNKVVLYFHGNAGDLGGWQKIHKDFTSLGLNFLIIDYRGFGKSSGNITEKGLYKDADAAFLYLLKEGFKKENIIVYGRSVGTGVATELASKNKICSLILESPFASLTKLAGEKVPYFLPWIFLQFRFNSAAKINNVTAPLLLIHGDKDDLIPMHHSENLFATFNGTKKMVIIKGGEHNNLSTFSQYHIALKEYVEGLK